MTKVQQRQALGTITNSVLHENQKLSTGEIHKTQSPSVAPGATSSTVVVLNERAPREELQHNKQIRSSTIAPTTVTVTAQQTIASKVSIDEEDTISFGKLDVVATDAYASPDKNTDDFLSEEEGDTESEFLRVRSSRTCGSQDNQDTEVRTWTLQDFDYVHRLGSGGAATVYAAREVESGHLVALKIQELEDDDDGEALYEVDVHESVNSHDCIVSLYDYFYSDNTFGLRPKNLQSEATAEGDHPDDDSDIHEPKKYLIMIMELANRGSLFDVIRNSDLGYLPEPQAAFFLWDAVEAMEHVHSEDIIHCDVKALNFLVHNESCLLTDFGMGVHTDSRVIVGGSPMYMSPEHLQAWRDMTCNFDHRADIYSLGVMLYEMLVGLMPYQVIQEKEDDQGGTIDSEYAFFCATDDNIMGLEDNDEQQYETSINIDSTFRPPILDLRRLFDTSSDAPRIKVPSPVFPKYLSVEAKDLITQLMAHDQNERISLAEVKRHAWFQKNCCIS